MMITTRITVKLWICAVICAVLLLTTGYAITITSSPQLGVDTVCDNQDVTLMCHTDQTTSNMITWYWSNQSQHGDTITVVARITAVVYTCVVSRKDGQQLEKLNITVVASGAPPYLLRANFSPYVYGYKKENLTFVTAVFSDLPLSSGDIKWVGFHRPLPSTAVVDNYTTDGILYSRLSLYEMSFEDDSGNYTNIVRNQCGTSSVYVFLEAHTVPNMCLNYASLAPLLSGPADLTTVEGEVISLECLYHGSYDKMNRLQYSYVFYWYVKFQNGEEPLLIRDNSTKSYRIAIYQTCLTANFSCCEFVSKLIIYDTSVNLDGAEVQCYEFMETTTLNTNDRISANSSLTVFNWPKVIKGPKNVRTSAGEAVNLTCDLETPTKPGVSIIVWLKDDFEVTQTSHNVITTTADPAKDLLRTTLTITSVTSEDNGKYTCYCYYNRSMVKSDQYVTSNQKSANVHVKTGSELSDQSKIAIIIATTTAILVVVVLWTVGTMICLVRLSKNRSAKLVNLTEYTPSSENDEKNPLLRPQEETEKRSGDHAVEYASDRSSSAASGGHLDWRQLSTENSISTHLRSLPPMNDS